jgi:hypothetical protein
MEKVHLFLATSDAMNPFNTAVLCNWAEEHKISILSLVSGLLPGNKFSANGSQLTPVVSIFGTTTKDNFKNLFGLDYSIENLLKIPDLLKGIIEKEGDSNGSIKPRFKINR